MLAMLHTNTCFRPSEEAVGVPAIMFVAFDSKATLWPSAEMEGFTLSPFEKSPAGPPLTSRVCPVTTFMMKIWIRPVVPVVEVPVEVPVSAEDVDWKATHWPSAEITGFELSPLAAPVCCGVSCRVVPAARSKRKIPRLPFEELPAASSAAFESNATRFPPAETDGFELPTGEAAELDPEWPLLQLGTMAAAARSNAHESRARGIDRTFIRLVLHGGLWDFEGRSTPAPRARSGARLRQKEPHWAAWPPVEVPAPLKAWSR